MQLQWLCNVYSLIHNQIWTRLLDAMFLRENEYERRTLTSLSMIWTRGSSAPSDSLQTTPSRAGDLICLKVGRLHRGTWIGWIDGPRLIVWDSTRPSARSSTWVTTPCNRLGEEWLEICLAEKDLGTCPGFCSGRVHFPPSTCCVVDLVQEERW